MKYYPLSLLFFVLLIFAGCGNKCGEDVGLGNFELLPESVENWYPYEGINELIFKNAEGEIVTLEIGWQKREMTYFVLREICWESTLDYAQEYYWGECLSVQYGGAFNNINYSISVELSVMPILYYKENIDKRPYDKVFYEFNAFKENETGYGSGGTIYFVVNNRGYTISDDDLYSPPDFAQKMEINGITYNDVWYSNYECTPTLYVQQGKGIIAFLGLNEEIWGLQ